MEIENLKPQIRYLNEMKTVLFDKEWAKTAPTELELYYMYRDLSKNEKDKKAILKAGLRYDITVIPSMMLGKEYNKTAGHDHPLTPRSKLSYPEIYQVLEGEAIFLIQDSQENAVRDVYAVLAKKDDQIIIPPNYEHLIINASAERLKTANWVYRGFSPNIYEPFQQKQGFSYFALKNDSGINWVKNLNYSSVPDLEFKEPNYWLDKFQIPSKQEIYRLVNNLEKLNFLKNPDEYSW